MLVMRGRKRAVKFAIFTSSINQGVTDIRGKRMD